MMGAGHRGSNVGHRAPEPLSNLLPAEHRRMFRRVPQTGYADAREAITVFRPFGRDSEVSDRERGLGSCEKIPGTGTANRTGRIVWTHIRRCPEFLPLPSPGAADLTVPTDQKWLRR